MSQIQNHFKSSMQLNSIQLVLTQLSFPQTPKFFSQSDQVFYTPESKGDVLLLGLYLLASSCGTSDAGAGCVVECWSYSCRLRLIGLRRPAFCFCYGLFPGDQSLLRSFVLPRYSTSPEDERPTQQAPSFCLPSFFEIQRQCVCGGSPGLTCTPAGWIHEPSRKRWGGGEEQKNFGPALVRPWLEWSS